MSAAWQKLRSYPHLNRVLLVMLSMVLVPLDPLSQSTALNQRSQRPGSLSHAPNPVMRGGHNFADRYSDTIRIRKPNTGWGAPRRFEEFQRRLVCIGGLDSAVNTDAHATCHLYAASGHPASSPSRWLN